MKIIIILGTVKRVFTPVAHKCNAANVQIKGLQKGLPGNTVPGRVNWTLDFLLIGAAKFALGLASHPGSIRLERPYQG